MTEFISHSPADTEAFAEDLAEKLCGGEIIAFKGPMGMGKTCFTRGLARGLGFSGQVTSPTFALVNEYTGGRLPLYHFDMYRIESEDDLYSIGYDEYISANAYSIVEWSENITDFIPEGAITVTIERTPEGEVERNITIDMGSKYENISI